jgi:hypothetical protein
MQLKIRTNLQSHPAKRTAKVRLAPFLSSKDRSEIIQNTQVLTLRGLGQTVGTNTYKIAAVKFAKPCWSALAEIQGKA